MANTSSIEPTSAWTTPKTVAVYSPALADQGGDSAPPRGSSYRPPQRFVAGDTFFHYDAYGSLRPLEDPIRLWSRPYNGLAIHATLCGFIYFFSNGYGEVLAAYLKLNDNRQATAVSYLLVWPKALAIVVGFVLDTFPLFGYRRKSYMILGLVISFAAYAAVAVVDTYGRSHDQLNSHASSSVTDRRESQYPITYLVMSLVASIGIHISWISFFILAVEYAQREMLLHRGALIATLVSLFYFGGFVAYVVIRRLRSGSFSVLRISIGEAATVLAIVSSAMIPFVLWGLKEEPFEYQLGIGSVKYLSIRDRASHLWKFCHHNIFYRVIFFIGLHMFLTSLIDQNVKTAVVVWLGVTQRDFDVIKPARMAAQVVGTVLWGLYLRNVSWRKLAFLGTMFFLSVRVVVTLCTVLDTVRDKWFFGAMMMAADIPTSWLVLYGAILATEIAELGHEGVIFTLAFSFQALTNLSSSTLAAHLQDIYGFHVSLLQIAVDQASTRLDVLQAFFIVLGLNLLSLPLIRLLPQQKLDAQQQRAFGGYNKCAGVALAITFVTMLVSNFVANLADIL